MQTKKTAGPNDRQSANAAPQSFASMPFNMNTLPNDFASIFTNMTANTFPGQHFQYSEGDQNAPSEVSTSFHAD